MRSDGRGGKMYVKKEKKGKKGKKGKGDKRGGGPDGNMTDFSEDLQSTDSEGMSILVTHCVNTCSLG